MRHEIIVYNKRYIVSSSMFVTGVQNGWFTYDEDAGCFALNKGRNYDVVAVSDLLQELVAV